MSGRRVIFSPDLQRGRALLELLAGTAFIILVLGALGPALDAPTRSYASYGYTPDQAGEHRRLELDAQRRCAQDRDRGDNAGYVITADGAVVCTDKHGRARRNRITIAVKTEARP